MREKLVSEEVKEELRKEADKFIDIVDEYLIEQIGLVGENMADKQLLLDDLIKVVEYRQTLKIVGDIVGNSDEVELINKQCDKTIEVLKEQINRDRTREMSDFWVKQALKQKNDTKKEVIELQRQNR